MSNRARRSYNNEVADVDSLTVSTGGTTTMTPTLKNLQQYLDLQMGGKGSEDDDTATFVSNMVNNYKSNAFDDASDIENEPLSSSRKITSDTQSIHTTPTLTKYTPFQPRATPRDSSMNKPNFGTRRDNVDKDLDHILESMTRQKDSKKERSSFDKWEGKVQNLAQLIDEEKNNALKLSEIEEVLNEKRKKLKADIKAAQWEAKILELERLLESKRREKESKLRKLASTLEDLKQEKKAMRKLTKCKKMSSRV